MVMKASDVKRQLSSFALW